MKLWLASFVLSALTTTGPLATLAPAEGLASDVRSLARKNEATYTECLAAAH